MDPLEKANDLYKKVLDKVNIKDDGCTVYTKSESGIDLSPGCQCCKEGTWNCLYIGRACNAQCFFCTKPKTPHPDEKEGYYHEFLINDYINLIVNQDIPLKGISFSGGETLLYKEKFIFMASELTKKAPWIYKWIYTNGALVNEENIKIMKDVGINEIRFNLLAFDFCPEILENVLKASKVFKRVTVEIPSLDCTLQRLLNNNMLQKLVDSGVTQLNLPEYYYRGNVARESIKTEVYRNKFGFFSPVDSRKITAEIIKYTIINMIPILVNDCSAEAKYHQMKVRKHNNLLRMY